MRAVVTRALVLALLLTAPAGAADLELGLDVGTVYNSNLFGSPTDPHSDFSARIGPRLRAMDEVGAFTWDVRYWPSYEKYLDISEADGWDHDLDARAAWRVSRRTRFRFSERFLDTGNVNEIFNQAGLPDPTVDTGLQFGRDRIRTNTASLAMDHSLAPRHDTVLTLQRTDSRFQREIQSKSTVTGLGGSYLYTWDQLNRLGVLLSGTQQDVTTGDADSQATRYYNLSFQWIRSFDPTLTLNASAGPTWVDQDRPELPSTVQIRRYPLIAGRPIRASSCPRNGQGELYLGESCEGFGLDVQFTDAAPFLEAADVERLGGVPTGQSLTYFADISLTKDWRNFKLTLSYTRDASTTSELSGIVLDNLSAYLIWSPSTRWNVALRTSYQRREQPTSGIDVQPVVEPATVAGVSDVAEATAFRLVTRKRVLVFNDYLGGVFVNYRLNRWTRLYLNVTYQYEDLTTQLDRSVLENGSWDRIYVSVGVTYTLPPMHLPF